MRRCATDYSFLDDLKGDRALTRRDFLRAQARGALALGAAASGLWLPGFALAEPYPDIAVAEGGAGPATRAAVGLLGGMEKFVKRGHRVVIKPNMSFANPPERATNTHPLVVRELVSMCREAGAKRVLVLDNVLHSAELCLEKSGIKEACRPLDDPVHILNKRRYYRRVGIPKGVQFKQTDVMKEVLGSDVLIAVPVAKSHGSTGVTLSMKGMMGLILDRWVMHTGHDLNTAIVDLCTILTPRLAVVDATRILTENGPYGPGRVVRKNMVLASADMVAADAMAVTVGEWYGRKFKPRQVKHIRMAHERGLGRMDVENLRVKKVRV